MSFLLAPNLESVKLDDDNALFSFEMINVLSPTRDPYLHSQEMIVRHLSNEKYVQILKKIYRRNKFDVKKRQCKVKWTLAFDINTIVCNKG
jgi:hypothetical protein